MMNHFHRKLPGRKALAVFSAVLFSGGAAFAQSVPAQPQQHQPAFEVDAGGRALSRAFHAYRNGVEVFAGEYPEVFGEVLDQAFGEKLSDTVRQEIIDQGAARTLPVPALIIFVDDSVLGDASAAYCPKNDGTVFIASRYRYDFEALTQLVTEECGHHLDHCLGGEDSKGDEGAIYQEGIFDAGPILEEDLQELREEQDHTQIDYKGQTFEVELGRKERKARRAKRKQERAEKKKRIEKRQEVKKVEKAEKKKRIEKRREVKKAERKENRQERHEKIKKAFESAGKAVGGAVVGVAEATYKTTIAVGKGVGETVVNTGKTIGHMGESMVLATRAVAASMRGDDEEAERLTKKSDKAYDKSNAAAKNLGKSVLDVVTAPGNGYNEAIAAINENIPYLGTAIDFAIGLTPAGPYLAAAKGAADIRNAIQNNPDNPLKAGLTAGAYVAVDVGGPGAGKYFGKMGKLKDTAKYWDDVAKVGTRSRRVGAPLGTRPGLVSRGFNELKGKGTYESAFKYGTKGTGFVIKGLIPGHQRDEDGRLLGKGASKFGVGKSFLKPSYTPPRPSAPPGGSFDFGDQFKDYIAGIQLGSNGIFNGPFVEGPKEIIKRIPTPETPRVSNPPPVVTAPPTGGGGGGGTGGGMP